MKYYEVLSIKKAIEEKYNVHQEKVMIHSTHSHEGPNVQIAIGDILNKWGLVSCNFNYFQMRKEQVISAFGEALVDLHKVTDIKYGEAPVDRVASYRRIKDNNGDIILRESRPQEKLKIYPEGRIDPLVRSTVLLRGEHDGILIFSYSCHPTAAGGDEAPYVTGDFPGYATKLIREKYGFKTLYLTEPCGDINPGKYIRGSGTRQEDVAIMGRRLAAGVKLSLEQLISIESDKFAYKTKGIKLPLKSDLHQTKELETKLKREVKEYIAQQREGKRIPGGGQLRRTSYAYYYALRGCNGFLTTEIGIIKLGKILFVLLPGEPFLQMGIQIRKRVKFIPCHNAENCDVVSYIAPPKDYLKGGYEVKATPLDLEAFDILFTEVESLLESFV